MILTNYPMEWCVEKPATVYSRVPSSFRRRGTTLESASMACLLIPSRKAAGSVPG
jgi:hypothetical protein